MNKWLKFDTVVINPLNITHFYRIDENQSIIYLINSYTYESNNQVIVDISFDDLCKRINELI